MAFSEITNSIQLLKLLKILFTKFDCHVVAKDQLKEIEPKKKQIVIVNIDDSGNEGTHWTCFVCAEPKYAIFFDSYAVNPPKEVLEFMKQYKNKEFVKDIVMNTKKVQPIAGNMSSGCGWFCLKFLELYILKNKTALKAIHEITINNTLKLGKILYKKYL